MKPSVFMPAVLLLASTTTQADGPALDSARDELAEARALAADLRAEWAALRAALPPPAAERFERWKAEHDGLRRDRLALERERQKAEHERSEIARLTAFHRARQPLPRQPGDPILLAAQNQPRFTAPPRVPYSQPYYTPSYLVPSPWFYRRLNLGPCFDSYLPSTYGTDPGPAFQFRFRFD